MEWINELFFGSGIAHMVLVLAIVISLGVALGKVKIFGISPGITMVLFVGIVASHFGLRVESNILHFVKEFGLILFVFAVGLQVGPGFFASFKKGGISLNILAVTIVALGVIITIALKYITGYPISTMVGILSGAVTNTPGLGAAQQAYTEMHGQVDPTIGLGYAVAYPLGVVGIITSIILVRYIFRISFKDEEKQLEEEKDNADSAYSVSAEVSNPYIFDKPLIEISKLSDSKFIISRVLRSNGNLEVASQSTVLREHDRVLIVTSPQYGDKITELIGKVVEVDVKEWNKLDQELASHRIVITKSIINGKSLMQLNLRAIYGVNVTRVNRSGLDLIAQANLKLQIGDRLTVVGSTDAVKRVEEFLGNKEKHLNEPNLVAIFLGIFLGVFLGSIPFHFPGIPQPVKLGLAGGPLIVAILLSIFGPKFKLVTYTTASANLMLKEVGICLFLACVGIEAGEKFVETVANGGYYWVGLGVIITMVPLLIASFLGRKIFKLNYFTLMGVMAGSMTDPPALAYSSSTAGNDAPAVSYASVYPLVMFLRVLSAQLLIIIFS